MTYGPGVTLLAAVTGHEVSEVASSPSAALRAMAAFAKDMAALAADRASDDPAVRAAAEHRATEIAALARAADPDPRAAGDRLRARIEEALTKVLHDLEAAN